MDPSTLFRICNAAVLPGWLLLILAPRWSGTRRLVAPLIIPMLLAFVYLYLVVAYFGSAKGGFGTLEGVTSLFADQHVLLAGWVHYLVFDLFIGSWELRDSQELGISHLLLVPCLIVTFAFGPVGLLLYFLLRTVSGHGLMVGEERAR